MLMQPDTDQVVNEPTQPSSLTVKCINHLPSSQWTVTLSRQDMYMSKMTYKPSELGQADLVSVFFDQSSSVGLCM